MENKKEIEEAKEMLTTMVAPKEAKSYDILYLVENALLSFLEFRINKLIEDVQFQDELKAAIRARLPEGDLNDLRLLLDQEQANTNKVAFNLMAPFNDKIKEGKTQKNSAEEDVFNSSNKDSLQNFNELFQMLQQIQLASKEKKSSPIKEALKESLKEEPKEESSCP